MDIKSAISNLRISTKLVLLNLLICAAFMVIFAVVLFSFVNTRKMLTQITHKNLEQVIANSQTCHLLSNVFTDIDLLTYTFYGRDDYLKSAGDRLTKTLENLSTKVDDPGIKKAILTMSQGLRSFIIQAQTVDATLDAQKSIDSRFLANLSTLEETIDGLTIKLTLAGKDTSSMEQLATLVIGYRESLYQIGKKQSELENSHNYDLPEDKKSLILKEFDDLILRIKTLTASVPSVAVYGDKLTRNAEDYRQAILRFDRAMQELGVKDKYLKQAKSQVLAAMENTNKKVGETTEILETSIRKIIFSAGLTASLLSLVVVISLIIFSVYFIRATIKNPMRAVQEALESFRQGNFNTRIRLNRGDEWDTVEKAFNAMAADLLKTYGELREALSIINRSPAVTFRWKNETGWPVEFVSDNVESLLGYTAEDLVSGRIPYQMIVHPDDIDRVTAEVANHAIDRDGARFVHKPYRIITKDGAVKWVEVKSYIRRDQNGQVTHLQGIVEDITVRTQAEEERLRLATVIEQAAESVIISDRNGTIHYVNPAFEKLSGFARTEIVGQNFRVLKSHKHDESFYKQMRQHIFRGEVWKGTIVNTVKDGTLREFETVISPIRDSFGKIVNFVSVNRDVTQESALRTQLQQSQKMQAVGTLAGGIAHDFNNLLQVIQGYADLLLMGRKSNEPDFRELQEIFSAAQRGAELTRQLLTFSRKVESQLLSINLNQAILRVKKLLDRTIPKMIDIELRLADDLNIVFADPGQMEQVLMNLAINAKDAMPEGGRLLIATENIVLNEEYCRSHLEASPGAYVVLSISDTGHGMNPEILEHIFEPFYTTKETGQGTGLGLAMVYGIVKNHHGHITCYSEPGEGTTFKIYLPCTDQGQTLAVEQMMERQPVGGTETILLVDDDDAIRDFGRQILEKFGYTVFTAEDGEKALELFRNEKEGIDLVILDLIMPGMGGKKCLEKLLETSPSVKVVVTSGFSPDEHAEKIISSGAKVFISKPFHISQMLIEIRKVLEDKIDKKE